MSIHELAMSDLAVWNERDPERGRELIAATWSEGGTGIDAYCRGTGHAMRSPRATLDAAQATCPGGEHVDARLYLDGTDVVAVGGHGRPRSAAGFMGPAPAAVK